MVASLRRVRFARLFTWLAAVVAIPLGVLTVAWFHPPDRWIRKSLVVLPVLVVLVFLPFGPGSPPDDPAGVVSTPLAVPELVLALDDDGFVEIVLGRG